MAPKYTDRYRAFRTGVITGLVVVGLESVTTLLVHPGLIDTDEPISILVYLLSQGLLYGVLVGLIMITAYCKRNANAAARSADKTLDALKAAKADHERQRTATTDQLTVTTWIDVDGLYRLRIRHHDTGDIEHLHLSHDNRPEEK